VLDMTLRDIERVLYFEAYVVVDPGMTPLKRGQMHDRGRLSTPSIEEYGDEFIAPHGRRRRSSELLAQIDIDAEDRASCATT
jgi:DNA-directed RNA polymerase subunit beta'